MDNFCEIHQAAGNELTSIAEFLNSAVYVHRHLDWRTIFEWLDKTPFLVFSEDKEIKAVLVAVPDPPGAAWIRCFAVGSHTSPNTAWEILAPYAKSALEPLGAKMVAVGLNEWFSRMLVHHGFEIRQKIVVLEWNHQAQPSLELPSGFLIRPMIEADLVEVADVDQRSFEPIWVNTPNALRAAYSQSVHCSIAEHEGKIIGYEMSTASQYNAHLARLAVLPEFRQQNIGKVLVSKMLADFSKKSMVQVTVNTQNDNKASLHLYKSLGFLPTYEEYPVLFESE